MLLVGTFKLHDMWNIENQLGWSVAQQYDMIVTSSYSAYDQSFSHVTLRSLFFHLNRCHSLLKHE
jgi:hypothetical protein